MKPPHVSYRRFLIFLFTMFLINLAIFFYVQLIWNLIMAIVLAGLITFFIYDWYKKDLLKYISPRPPKH